MPTLIEVVVVLLIVGVLLWGLQDAPAIDPTMKQFVRVAVIVVAAIWLLLKLYAMFSGHGHVLP